MAIQNTPVIVCYPGSLHHELLAEVAMLARWPVAKNHLYVKLLRTLRYERRPFTASCKLTNNEMVYMISSY